MTLPSVPVTMTLYVPGVTEEPAETVSVEALPAITEVGESATVGPAGETPAARLIVIAEPLVTAVPTAEVVLPPVVIDKLVGVALSEKSFVAGPLVTSGCERAHSLVSFDHVDCMA